MNLKMISKGYLCKLPLAIFFIGLGISSLIYTPTEFLYDLRLRMIPGTPPYQLWVDPPENIIMNVYVFNITNSERFLNGTDDELHLQEVGPIIYREKVTHTNIVFNANSTLTYTAKRVPVYLPERNTINLNDTLIVPNLGALVMASYFHDSSFLVKASINMLLNRYSSKPLVQTTIYNYLLNETDPVLEPAKLIGGSGILPTTNVGCLNQMYRKHTHNVTVLIGPKHGHTQFFNIDKYDGLEHISGFKTCLPTFVNTSETTLFPQFLTKDIQIWGWKSILCKLVEAHFTNETARYGMPANRYDVPLNLFDRTEPSNMDCYKGRSTNLPNGVADVSPCYNGYPLVASFPHFMNADPSVTKRLRGLNPDITKHGSFLIMEKLSGVPMGGRAIFQVNLNTQKLNGFNSEFRKFSNLFIPMSYIGYEIEGLPWLIYTLLFIMSVIIPNTQLIMSLSFVGIGLLLLYFLILDFRRRVRRTNLLSSIEKEKFLK